MRSLKTILDESNPVKLPSGTQVAKLGSLLAAAPAFVAAAVASDTIVLPEGAKAAFVLGGFASAGTTTGALTPGSGTPATGEVAVSPTGDLVFASADALTAAEVTYVPVQGEVIEEVVEVASNVGTLLQGRGAVVLLEVEALAGTSVGAKTVVARAATPSAGEAGINAAGTGIAFNGTDAVTQARVRYIATPGVGTSDPSLVANLLSEDRVF